MRHAWRGGEVYLKDARAWVDAYYEQNNEKHCLEFMGCYHHGCRQCYKIQTRNLKLKYSMGDLYRETTRWIKVVKHYGYKLTVVWECEWDALVRKMYAFIYLLKKPVIYVKLNMWMSNLFIHMFVNG